MFCSLGDIFDIIFCFFDCLMKIIVQLQRTCFYSLLIFHSLSLLYYQYNISWIWWHKWEIFIIYFLFLGVSLFTLPFILLFFFILFVFFKSLVVIGCLLLCKNMAIKILFKTSIGMELLSGMPCFTITGQWAKLYIRWHLNSTMPKFNLWISLVGIEAQELKNRASQTL